MNSSDFLCPFESKIICNDIPTVEYKESWHAGGTGYIDGVKPTDPVFEVGSVVKFIDGNWERSAISIKYTVACPTYNDEDSEKEYAVTAFQRYTDVKSVWVFGGHYKHGKATLGEVDRSWLEKLLLNEQAEFEISRYDSESGSYIKEICTVILFGGQSDQHNSEL